MIVLLHTFVKVMSYTSETLFMLITLPYCIL